jgi:hypothetical protein
LTQHSLTDEQAFVYFLLDAVYLLIYFPHLPFLFHHLISFAVLVPCGVIGYGELNMVRQSHSCGNKADHRQAPFLFFGEITNPIQQIDHFVRYASLLDPTAPTSAYYHAVHRTLTRPLFLWAILIVRAVIGPWLWYRLTYYFVRGHQGIVARDPVPRWLRWLWSVGTLLVLVGSWLFSYEHRDQHTMPDPSVVWNPLV